MTRENEFTISMPKSKVRCARLVIGLQNQGGLEEPIRGKINGEEFRHDTSWGRGVQDFFEQAIIEIPRSHLQTDNRITLEPIDGTTITEVHLKVDTLTEP